MRNTPLSILIIFTLALSIFPHPARADMTCAADPKDGTPVRSDDDGLVNLSRGVNLSRWWEDSRDRVLDVDEIHRLHTLGFDFVRLPVSPTWLQIADPNEQAEELQKLHCDILMLLREGLSVVIDLHPANAFDQKLSTLAQDDVVATLEKLWRVLQQPLTGLSPERVFLEIYNEPKFAPAFWWSAQKKILADLRPIFPNNTFIATPSPSSGWWSLIKQTPYDDANIIYDIHYYEPLIFTHHGVEWLPTYSPAEAALPIPYPVSKNFRYDITDPAMLDYAAKGWNQASASHVANKIAAWAKAKRAEVVCFEFGVYRPHVDDASRLNWLRDVRTAFEDAGIPWALWEYRGPFGLTDARGTLDENMAEALGLGHSAEP